MLECPVSTYGSGSDNRKNFETNIVDLDVWGRCLVKEMGEECVACLENVVKGFVAVASEVWAEFSTKVGDRAVRAEDVTQRR